MKRLLLAGCLLLCVACQPVRPLLFDSYTMSNSFALPAGTHLFDVLADGRLVALVNDELFGETAVGSRQFTSLGVLPGAAIPSFGAAFVRVSPDGSKLAVGDNNGRVGVFEMATLAGVWFTAMHADAEWYDNTLLALTAGEFGNPSVVVGLDTTSADPANPSLVTVIQNIGGASAGIAFDAAGNLYTGNGLADANSATPSETGMVKAFAEAAWRAALTGGPALDFETEGTLVVDILSAGSLGFDKEGNLYVGGGDVFGEGIDVNFAALVRRKAIQDALAGLGAADALDPNEVRRFDPEQTDEAGLYVVNFNPVTQELYFRQGANDTVFPFVAAATPTAAAALENIFAKEDALDIRIVSYNVAGRFIATAATDAAYARLLRALAPDIIVFQEITQSAQGRIAERLGRLLGGTWSVHGGKPSGIFRTVIASRYPLSMMQQDTVPPSSTRGVTLARVDLPDAHYAADLYLLGVHLQCCDSAAFEAQRQRSADAIAAWMGDARQAGGAITLPPGTPMIVLGDFNLVGSAQPGTTIVTGDIVDEATFGSDVKGDWDGSELVDLTPTDPASGEANTWPSNVATPSHRYDRFVYTDSVVTVAKSFILNCLTLAASQLAAGGLQANDSATASDHLPLVVDLRLASGSV